MSSLALERLTVLGSALLVGAHPDDENSAVVAHLVRGLKVRTAYLSLTRGEGGQNLLGPEQGEALGLIRTRELLDARRIDGAEQYFTRAIDFGYSKTAAETLRKWGHEAVLADVVWIIRRFRPDVMVSIFTGTPRDGHGHHQAAGVLAREAFSVAADPSMFPEQFRWVEPWQTRRLLQGGFTATIPGEGDAPSVQVNTGELDAELGVSYAEIARMSRRVHQSQGMDTPGRQTPATEFLIHLAGEPLSREIFEGIDTTWNRVPGGAEVGSILQRAQKQESLGLLLEARPLVAAIRDPWGAVKLRELDEVIASCAGLRVEVLAEPEKVVPGGSVQVTLSSGVSYQVEIPPDQPCSQPYWLRKPHPAGRYTVDDQELIGLAESPPVLNARLHFVVGSQEIKFIRPVPVTVVPPVSVKFTEPVLLFPDGKDKIVEVELSAGELRMEAPTGWGVRPAPGVAARAFTVTPPAGAAQGELRAVAGIASATAKLVRADVRCLARRVGYVMGAGDEMPRSLRQMGCEVTLLEDEDFGRFDAIVTGVRAFNVRPELRANRERWLDYIWAGGTMVVQYNVADGRSPEAVANIGPYPLKCARGRVTDEEAPVTFLNPASPLVASPNQLSEDDFRGWVQERGLYFASEWDPRYEPLFACHDAGEDPLTGATLYARYGKGAYVFTAFSWFRQLPAGVAGAFRIFANLLSAGKL